MIHAPVSNLGVFLQHYKIEARAEGWVMTSSQDKRGFSEMPDLVTHYVNSDLLGLVKAASKDASNVQQTPQAQSAFEPTVVQLHRGGAKSLGCKLQVGHTGHAVFVTSSKKNTPAALCKPLQPGVRFLEIDGLDVSRLDKKSVANALKKGGQVLDLKVLFDPIGYAKMLAQEDKNEQKVMKQNDATTDEIPDGPGYGFDEAIGGDYGFGKRRSFNLSGSQRGTRKLAQVTDGHGYIGTSAAKGWPSIQASTFEPTPMNSARIRLPDLPPVHFVDVDWKNKSDKLGLSMVPAQSSKGVYIEGSKRDSPAGLALGIHPGLLIVSINDVSVEDGQMADCIKQLRGIKGKEKVKFGVRYDPIGYSRAVTNREYTQDEQKKASKPIKVDLPCSRPNTTFGFQLLNADNGSGVYIVGVVGGSVASSNNKLRAGLCFQKVNKVDVSKFNVTKLMQLLANCDAKITLQLNKDTVGYARALAYQKMATIPGMAASTDSMEVASNEDSGDQPTTREHQPLALQIQRAENQSIGVALIEGHAGTGTYVSSVSSNSILHSTKINTGWKIIALNGSDTENLTKDECLEALKHTGTSFELVAQFDPQGFAKAVRRVHEKATYTPEVFEIQRTAEAQSWGVKLLASSTGVGVYLGGAVGGSPAANNLNLIAGLKFVEINGVDVLNMDKSALVGVLKGAALGLQMTLQYDPIGHSAALLYKEQQDAAKEERKRKAAAPPATEEKKVVHGDSTPLDLSRKDAEYVVKHMNLIGGYCLRESPQAPTGMALTVLHAEEKVTHLSILKSNELYYVAGSYAMFGSVQLLLEGYEGAVIDVLPIRFQRVPSNQLDNAIQAMLANKKRQQLRQDTAEADRHRLTKERAGKTGATMVPGVGEVEIYTTTKQQGHVVSSDVTSAAAQQSETVSPSTTEAQTTEVSTRPIKNVKDVGQRCRVDGYDSDGTIRFIGKDVVKQKLRVGVELDLPVGKNDGTIKGNKYFTCEPKHGVYVVPKKVSVITESSVSTPGASANMETADSQPQPKQPAPEVTPPKNFIHEASVTRAEVEQQLQKTGASSGTFLIRKRDAPGEYVLSVIYKGKPTHHLCATNASGNILISKKDFCKTNDILKVAERLSSVPLPPGWPVQLTISCNVDGSQSDATERKAGPAPSVDADKPAANTAAPKKPSVRKSKSASSGTEWLHTTGYTKDAAGALLTKESSGADGAFFLRPRGPDHPDSYVIAVIYKGKPTHHLVAKKDGVYTINNKPTGATGLDKVCPINACIVERPYCNIFATLTMTCSHRCVAMSGVILRTSFTMERCRR